MKQVIWFYSPFTMNYRDVDEFLVERDIDVNYVLQVRTFLQRDYFDCGPSRA